MLNIASVSQSGSIDTTCGDTQSAIDSLISSFRRKNDFLLSKSIEGPNVFDSINVIKLTFNEDIVHFTELELIIDKLTGPEVLKNRLTLYSPKFTVNYVIERLTLGYEITKLSKDHIKNLW